MIERKLSDVDRSILLNGIARVTQDTVIGMSSAADDEDVPRLKAIIHRYDECKALEHVIKHAVPITSTT